MTAVLKQDICALFCQHTKKGLCWKGGGNYYDTIIPIGWGQGEAIGALFSSERGTLCISFPPIGVKDKRDNSSSHGFGCSVGMARKTEGEISNSEMWKQIKCICAGATFPSIQCHNSNILVFEVYFGIHNQKSPKVHIWCIHQIFDWLHQNWPLSKFGIILYNMTPYVKFWWYKCFKLAKGICEWAITT